jgi:glyoxylase-like metal-dependent hydrolase (beta-lactamase superfamily II)/8-oxo-dGTP pyrophosphatase MutT (NUDIX family)
VNQKAATPKDASAVILLNQNFTEVLWAQRNPKLAFLGGWHAFPGGKVEPSDAEIEVKNCADIELAKSIVAAVRECFEETGVLLVRGGEKLTKGQRASLHDDLTSGRNTFPEILADWNLWIDAEDFFYTGFWTTPQFSPVRFKTRFFIAVCPLKQTPYAAISELRDVEFIAPAQALERWTDSEVLISPPVLISLKELAKFSTQRRRDAEFDKRNEELISHSIFSSASLRLCVSNLLENSQNFDGDIHYIEFNPRLICFPLKTETLPPATHTNCFIAGRREFVVIDAASKDDAEHRKLFELIDSFIEKGFKCKEIIVSHLHRDHFGGEAALKKHLQAKFGLEIPISAHKITAESLQGEIKFDKFIEDREVFHLKDENGKAFELKALHTPGHARGHLCFYDEQFGFLLSSDNVVGTGTVVIAPPEGDMTDYLASLERMKNLPRLRFLCGSHGAAVFDARGKIEEYIAHRWTREKQILEAVAGGAKTPEEIVEKVYVGLKPELFPLAAESVKAHLAKISRDGL